MGDLIVSVPDHCLSFYFLYKVYKLELEMLEGDSSQSAGTLSWAGEVKKMLCELGFAYFWKSQRITRLQLQQVVQRLYYHYIQSWYSCLNNSSKLSAYRTVKTQFHLKYI